MAAKKPRKKATKDMGILIRVSEAQKETLAKAAENAGIGLSTWMLERSLEAAKKAEPGSRG